MSSIVLLMKLSSLKAIYLSSIVYLKNTQLILNGFYFILVRTIIPTLYILSAGSTFDFEDQDSGFGTVSWAPPQSSYPSLHNQALEQGGQSPEMVTGFLNWDTGLPELITWNHKKNTQFS